MIKTMKDFQIPMRVETEKEIPAENYARFMTEAFERGFGTTVGNSLRRVLLSSLPGAAITSVASPRRAAIFCQSAAKWPVSTISTASPGLRVLTSAASHAPVPDAG